jgi:hypothetical protein
MRKKKEGINKQLNFYISINQKKKSAPKVSRKKESIKG